MEISINASVSYFSSSEVEIRELVTWKKNVSFYVQNLDTWELENPENFSSEYHKTYEFRTFAEKLCILRSNSKSSLKIHYFFSKIVK